MSPASRVDSKPVPPVAGTKLDRSVNLPMLLMTRLALPTMAPIHRVIAL